MGRWIGGRISRRRRPFRRRVRCSALSCSLVAGAVGEKDANKPYHGLWERPRLRRSRYLFALAHNWAGLFCVNYTSSSPYCGTGRPGDRFLGIFLFILSRFCKIYLF
jgi:hypothetical protein